MGFPVGWERVSCLQLPGIFDLFSFFFYGSKVATVQSSTSAGIGMIPVPVLGPLPALRAVSLPASGPVQQYFGHAYKFYIVFIQFWWNK